jgi:hypothetical protein
MVGSSDLQNWQPAAGATFTTVSGNRIRCSVSWATEAVRFYRLQIGQESMELCELAVIMLSRD